MGCPARFSIVVPVYNAKPEWLHGVVSSVQAQWYPNWELILADDASPSVQTRAFLEKLNDERIIVRRLEQNSGIAGATNAAIEIAAGDYVVFLDHDDELTPDCLFELAKRIRYDNPDYLYSDEDKLDARGRYVEPFFKPDWSPDTLMSTMYTCHVSCVRKSLLEKVGLLREEFNGAQDWDLVLRITEQTQRIAHIPKVLYHWRIVAQSTSGDLSAKPYAVEAGRRARESALERRFLTGTFAPLDGIFGFFSLQYSFPADTTISVIVDRSKARQDLAACIQSVARNSPGMRLEFIVVESSAEPDGVGSDAAASGQPYKTINVKKADTPAARLNAGAVAATGDLLLFLSADLQLQSDGGLARMGGYALLPHVAAVGGKILTPRLGRILHAGLLDGPKGPRRAFLLQDRLYRGHFLRNLLEFNWSSVSGDALMIRRETFQSLGRFHTSYVHDLADVDLCRLALDAGLFNIVCPSVEFADKGWRDVFRETAADEDLRLLRHRIPSCSGEDPYYNPNLRDDGSFQQKR